MIAKDVSMFLIVGYILLFAGVVFYLLSLRVKTASESTKGSSSPFIGVVVCLLLGFLCVGIPNLVLFCAAEVPVSGDLRFKGDAYGEQGYYAYSILDPTTQQYVLSTNPYEPIQYSSKLANIAVWINEVFEISKPGLPPTILDISAKVEPRNFSTSKEFELKAATGPLFRRFEFNPFNKTLPERMDEYNRIYQENMETVENQRNASTKDLREAIIDYMEDVLDKKRSFNAADAVEFIKKHPKHKWHFSELSLIPKTRNWD